MGASISSSGARGIAFESFGVRIQVTADTPQVIERIPALLPPGARPCPASALEESFGVLADGGGAYRLERGDSPVSTGLDLEFALMLLENQLGACVGFHAPSRIFVHAGVVAHEDKTIVIPCPSLAGKTTLVLELVRAGAVYYSDTFAVLDDRGLVHPFPSTPWQHEPGGPKGVGVERLNRGPGTEPLAIGTVVLTTYRPGALWKPTRLPPGRGVVATLAHTPAARTRPEEAIRVVSTALHRAVILEGERGEAGELVPQLLGAESTLARQ